MGLYGNLNTMSVPELLGWVEAGGKTGTLEVECDKIVKRIMFHEGRLASCSSNEPTTLLGQFLLSRGAITREVLSEALSLQGQSEKNLGQILLEMGAISQPDRDAFVEAKVEETIYGLFDWTEAVFRFHTEALRDPNAVDVDMTIQDVLEHGHRRSAERRLSRETITDPGIVLRRVDSSTPPEISGSRAAERLFELIDGTKTVAEILLHSHAPEFMVTKFLTALLHADVVEIAEVRTEVTAEVTASLDAALVALEETTVVAQPEAEPIQFEVLSETQAAAEQDTGAVKVEREYRPLANKTGEESRELQAEINVALQLMSSGQPEAALELLNAMAIAHPADVSLRQLVINAEKDFYEQMTAEEMHPSNVPTRTSLSETIANDKLTAEESFLLSHIDGQTNIQALLWVSPMRDVDALKALCRMSRQGWVEVRKAA